MHEINWQPRKETVFALGKQRKIQFFELSRLPPRAPNFSKLLKLVQHTPNFDPINSDIVFSDSFLCAIRF